MIIETITRHRNAALLSRMSAYIASRSIGDRFIFLILGILVIGSSLSGLYALERSLLVEVPLHGGTLTEGVVGSPRFVNPLLALSDADRDMTALVYGGLMGEDGKGGLIPVLAERYEISPDGLTYTFTLRGDATFSDGSAVTADDVVFTVEKAQDPGLKSPEFANWSGVTAIATDPQTVEFHLDRPYAPFISNTTLGILPAHLWRSVSDEEFPFSALMTMPVGAGPFYVASLNRNASGIVQSYELKRFDGYLPGAPYLSGMTMRFYPETEDLGDALKSGAVESAYGIPDKQAVLAPYSRVFGVFWNANQNALFARKEVREALSVALNRTKITQDTLGGFAEPLAGPVPPGSGITPTPIPESSDRVKTAATILEKAGWKYDTEARSWTLAKENLTLAFTLKTSNVPELKAVATAVKDDYALLGVPVDIELYEPGDLTQNVIRPRKYEALLFGMVIGRNHDLYAFWDSAERNDPGLNIALYTNSTVDDLLEKMREETDQASVTASLQKVNDLVAADYPAAFTHAPRFLYTLPSDMHGVALTQVASPSDRFAGVHGWYRRTEWVWPFLVPSGR